MVSFEELLKEKDLKVKTKHIKQGSAAFNKDYSCIKTDNKSVFQNNNSAANFPYYSPWLNFDKRTELVHISSEKLNYYPSEVKFKQSCLILRKPKWEIDLHGLNLEQASKLLNDFFNQARSKKIDYLRVIHGKGKEQGSILRDLTWHFFKDASEDRNIRNIIVAFGNPSIDNGGGGVLDIILKI